MDIAVDYIETPRIKPKAGAKATQIKELNTNKKETKDMNKEQFIKAKADHKKQIIKIKAERKQLKADIKRHRLLIKQAQISYKLSKMSKGDK